MADVYEKDLAQKTSLTTSDYIRVVGSDNVSYKQSVSSVVETVVGASAKALPSTITDLNDVATTSIYTIGSAVPTNAPITTGTWSAYVQTVRQSSTYMYQNYVLVNATTTEVYYRRYLNGTWGSWVKQPTRAEVDALTNAVGGVSFTATTTSVNVEKSITIPNGYRGVMWTIDSATSKCGQYIVYATGTGIVTLAPILTASGLTTSVSANTIRITSSGTTRIVFMNASGKATV